MSILAKFEGIEIKNDSRLCDEDRIFCEDQQDLYLKILKHYRIMFEKLNELNSFDCEFYKDIAEQNGYFIGGEVQHKQYSYEFIEMDKEKFHTIIKYVHDRFIEKINDYFRKKYNIGIERKTFDDYSQFEKPEQSNSYYWGYNRMSDEEIEKQKQSMSEYKQAQEKYLDCIINHELDFNIIIDDIFLLLDGFNFEEKALEEIKIDAQNAVTNNYSLKTEKSLLIY